MMSAPRSLPKRIGFAIALLALPTVSFAETGSVNVKYRGVVDLAPFTCTDIIDSSVVQRVCYDVSNSYMLINLKGAYYHYCEIDQGTVDRLLTADSKGKYFSNAIKGNGSDGPFDCRTHRVPQ